MPKRNLPKSDCPPKESYDKDLQAGVTERLKGKTPNLNGGSGGHNTGSFMDIIRENQR